MKALLLLLPMLASSVAWADTGSVDITSFRYSAPRSRIAELCGKVTGDVTFPAYVKVVVDPNASGPGTYTATVLDGGTFCVVVYTDTGRATAELVGTGFKADVQAGENLGR